MVNAFAHESGGRLRIQSKVGVGTSVQLTLPLTSAPNQAAPRLVPNPLTAAHGMDRVLIVDDEAPLLELLSMWLIGDGYSVRCCASGEEAWAALQQDMPDILITDVIMPGSIDGLELAQKAQALSARLRILLVSGFPIDGEKAISEMQWPMVAKPYRREALLAKIRELCSSQMPLPRAFAR